MAERTSGVQAFLDGKLRVRGNLALSMKLEGLFASPDRPAHFPRAGYASPNGIRTFYLEAGTGDAVILLHGLGATNSSMLPTLADMARDHRVIAPDLPGFGESAKPIRSYHAAYYAEWVLGLMDGLGIERADLIGNSMGARVAIEAGLVAPERFGRLALLAPSPAFIQRRQFVRIVRFLRPEMALLPLPIPTRRVVGGIKALFARPERLDGACIGRPRTSSSGSSTRPADASRSSRRRGRSISRSRGDRRGSGIDSPRCRCRRSSCGGARPPGPAGVRTSRGPRAPRRHLGRIGRLRARPAVRASRTYARPGA